MVSNAEQLKLKTKQYLWVLARCILSTKYRMREKQKIFSSLRISPSYSSVRSSSYYSSLRSSPSYSSVRSSSYYSSLKSSLSYSSVRSSPSYSSLRSSTSYYILRSYSRFKLSELYSVSTHHLKPVLEFSPFAFLHFL